MTVPVTQEVKNGNMTMQFYLPSRFNKDNAPKPVNSEVKILTIEGGYYAVIKYSCLLYTSPSPRDATLSRMPSSA